MFPSFISILDIQSWWEVPSIAHFCSLFRAAFNLLDFDIEELEEALLTDGTEDSGSSLLQELIVRLLCGCLGSNDVSTFNYQMFLRRLFRQKCQEHGRYNPFNTDIDFQFLPLRTKVEILHALCDFRLDAEDVLDLLKNLEAESLRVEPLGYDDNDSAYWYFYGTRLYREDYEKTSKKSSGNKQKSNSVWQVICFTEQDWNHLTSKFKGATSKTEKALYRSLSENFLPEIPRLFQEKERQQRKRLLELQPRRSSSRVQQKQRDAQQDEDLDTKSVVQENSPTIVVEENETKPPVTLSARELRAIQRDVCKSGSESGSRAESPAMPTQKADVSGLTSVGRQTNNSLASATGQILIQASTQRKKLKTSQVFRQSEEDLQTGMYKILEYVKNHDDAWPFIEPVEEDYAPNYYSIVRKPMDLQRMEDKLDAGEYLTFSRFKADFQLIVDNCRLYNGTDNEYTEMVDNLQQAFQRATDRFLDQITSSDEEIAVEFQQKSSTKENVKENNKKSKNNQLKKQENQKMSTTTGVKRKSSPIPQPIDKSTKSIRNNRQQRQHRKSESPAPPPPPRKSPTPPPIIEKKKTKQLRKEKSKVREKSPAISSSTPKKSKKSNKNVTRNSRRSKSRSRSRSRSQSKGRSWTSSPSPPPPRIQKKKKLKEKLEDVKKDKKWDTFVSKIDEKVLEHKSTSKEKDIKPSTTFHPINKTVKDKKKDKSIPQLSETIEKLKQNSINKKESLDLNYKPKVRDKTQHDSKMKNVKPKVKEKFKENKFDKKSSTSVPVPDNSEPESDLKESVVVIDAKKKHANKKVVKKAGVMKNPAAIKALDLATEQTLKDINKWLDDTPKFSELSNSPSQSPLPLTNLDDFDVVASNLETEYKLNQQKEKLLKQQQAAAAAAVTATTTTVVASPITVVPPPSVVPVVKPKEHTVKDPVSTFKRRNNTHKDFNKLQKRREIQRTIDRLQPGKSKGNLIANIQSNKTEDHPAFPLIAKLKDSKNLTQVVANETTPKLSLGTVLDSFGQQHNFVDEKEDVDEVKPSLESSGGEILKEENVENVTAAKIEDDVKEVKEITAIVSKDDVEQVKVPIKAAHKQENVTPNLSAWFKAFGAPKSAAAAAAAAKKQKDTTEIESKEAENVVSPVSTEERLKPSSSDLVDDTKKMLSSPMPSPAPEIPAIGSMGPNQPAPRTRKASTGSTVSERSSFSQDMTDPLDSPRLSVDERLGMYPAPYPSPMGASPHDEKNGTSSTYPPLNGNIRVGFYQDTVKSSPEKSCSPRDQPQSPHNTQQYSQHVYIPPPTSSTYHYSSNPTNSPSQSPVYNQLPPPPPYNSSHIINPFFDKAPPTPLTYDTTTTTTTPLTPIIAKTPPEIHPPQYNNHVQQESSSLSPPPTQPSESPPRQVGPTNTLQRPSPTPPQNVIKPHLNTVIPVKKRLYSESSEIDSRISSSPHNTLSAIQNMATNMSTVGPSSRGGGAGMLHHHHHHHEVMSNMFVNPESSFNKSFLPTTVSLDSSSSVKNYSMPINNTLTEIANRGSLDNTRGLNLQIPQTEPLNIPNPIKTIDLTGPDSPLYNNQQQPPVTTMNMPLDSRNVVAMEHNKNDMYQTHHSRGILPNTGGNPMDIVQLSQQYTAKNLLPTKNLDVLTQAIAVSQSQTNVTNTTQLPYNMNMHHNPRLDLRIPNVRSDNIVPHQQNSQDLQRNDFRTATESRLPSMQSTGINLDLTNNHTFNASALGNLANLSHIVDRYQNDERLLSGLASNPPPYYSDPKSLGPQQLYSKQIPTSIHPNSSHPSLQSNMLINTTASSMNYIPTTMQQQMKSSSPSMQQQEKKMKKRKSKTTSSSQAAAVVSSSSASDQGFQSYSKQNSGGGVVTTSEPSAISLKTASVVPGSAFNFGPAPSTLGLSSSLYNDKDSFSGFLDEYRNPTTNYYMAAQAAAVAHHNRSTPDGTDKSQRVPQPVTTLANSSSAPPYPYLGHHTQSRPTTYSPFIHTPHQSPLMDSSSPIYQQYLQRHQEELLRHSAGVLHQGLLGPPAAYPPGYPPLGIRQPFDAMNRPSWL